MAQRPGRRRLPNAAAVWLAVAAGPTLAPADSASAADARVTLTAYGLLAPGTLEYEASLAPLEYAEAGQLEARHEAGAGLGFELEAELRLARRLALRGAWGRLERDVEGSFDAQLPHPLYFDQPRAASGSFEGGRYRESAAHVSLAWRGGAGAWSYRVFAGASFFQVKADVVGGVDYTQEYPYDTVQVTGTRLVEAEDSPIGAHAGASVAYALGSHVGLVLRVRYGRATATLPVGDAGTVELEAGGAELALGLRLAF